MEEGVRVGLLRQMGVVRRKQPQRKAGYAADVGLWDENFFGWGEEDIDFSYRLYQHGLVPIFLASRNAVCYHLDHSVDHQKNTSTLCANARYLLRKFPEIVEHRRQAYSLFNIDIDALLNASTTRNTCS